MVGKMLSHYRLVEKIGEGGMGVVWKAEDTVLGRTVAIKVLPADVALDEERRQLFLNEARLAASLSHAHIVQVHDLGREGDLDFIVMEYVEGVPLSRLLHGHALGPEKVASIGLQIAEGLSRAHHRQLLHRDLKPGNVLVTPEGEVKIVDFGLATLFKGLESTLASSTVTLAEAAGGGEKPGSIVGTLPYMSPEQVRGEKLDARSDIFSFGTVLYEMTTGRRPFQGSTPAEIAQEILRSQPTPVQELAPKVPLELHRIIEKALSRKPEDRYQTLDDAAVDLRRLSKEIESGSWPSYADMQHTHLPKKQHPWLRVALLAAALLVAAGAWITRDRWRLSTKKEAPTGTSANLRPPNWILVAEFDGPPDDPTLATAARELISASLEQSAIVTPIPRSALKEGLQRAMKPDTTRVAGAVARELAVRAAARSYVEGRVDRVLHGYSVVVRVRNADDDRMLVSVNGLVENDELFIPTLDRLGRELRQGLGERRTEVQATRAGGDVITPSFEAYRLYLRSVDLGNHNKRRSALVAAKQALAIDPEFGAAWSHVMVLYTRLGLPDSSRMAFEEAIRRPERLTEPQRIRLEARRALNEGGGPEAVVRVYDLGIQQFPYMVTFYNNRGVMLEALGQYEDALASYARGNQVSPFGPVPFGLFNEFVALLNVGRVEDARRLLPSLEGYRNGGELEIAICSGSWSRAESLANSYISDPLVDEEERYEFSLKLACLRARRGMMRDAMAALVQVAAKTPNKETGYLACMALINLGIVSGSRLDDGLSPACGDSSARGALLQGLWASAQGDTSGARKWLEAAVELGCGPSDVRFVEALISARAARWEQVVEWLEPLETRGREGLTGRLPIRWLVAGAYEHMGRHEQAARHFALVLSPTRLAMSLSNKDQDFPLFVPFAHQRLVLIYAKMGKAEEARQHWKIFQETFTHPDPELVPQVEQARRAIDGLKGAS